MTVELFKVNRLFIKNQCYLLYDDDDDGILIDPAFNYHVINDFLRFNTIALKAVMLTHAHFDHTDLAQKFAKQYDVPVYMSDTEINDTGFKCTNLKPVKHLQPISITDSIKIVPIVTPGHTTGSTCYLINEHFFLR